MKLIFLRIAFKNLHNMLPTFSQQSLTPYDLSVNYTRLLPSPQSLVLLMFSIHLEDTIPSPPPISTHKISLVLRTYSLCTYSSHSTYLSIHLLPQCFASLLQYSSSSLLLRVTKYHNQYSTLACSSSQK